MKKRTVIGAMVLGTIVFCAIIAFGVQSSSNDDTKDLQLVHVVILLVNFKFGAKTKFLLPIRIPLLRQPVFGGKFKLLNIIIIFF